MLQKKIESFTSASKAKTNAAAAKKKANEEAKAKANANAAAAQKNNLIKKYKNLINSLSNKNKYVSNQSLGERTFKYINKNNSRKLQLNELISSLKLKNKGNNLKQLKEILKNNGKKSITEMNYILKELGFKNN